MKCPKCGADDDRVLDSRSVREGAAIRRRRECSSCGFRYTTHEEVDRDEVLVVKRDGRREPFSRMKLEDGVRSACRKLKVADAAVRNMIDEIIEAIDRDEVSSEWLGEQVMDRLRKIDEVAYVRFASVYRRFTDVDQFLSAVKETLGRAK